MIPFMSLLFLPVLFYVAQKTAGLLLWMVVQAIPCIRFAGESASEAAFQRLCCSGPLCSPCHPYRLLCVQQQGCRGLG